MYTKSGVLVCIVLIGLLSESDGLIDNLLAFKASFSLRSYSFSSLLSANAFYSSGIFSFFKYESSFIKSPFYYSSCNARVVSMYFASYYVLTRFE